MESSYGVRRAEAPRRRRSFDAAPSGGDRRVPERYVDENKEEAAVVRCRSGAAFLLPCLLFFPRPPTNPPQGVVDSPSPNLNRPGKRRTPPPLLLRGHRSLSCLSPSFSFVGSLACCSLFRRNRSALKALVCLAAIRLYCSLFS